LYQVSLKLACWFWRRRFLKKFQCTVLRWILYALFFKNFSMWEIGAFNTTEQISDLFISQVKFHRKSW
jgi:hypothetical protein